MAVFCSPSKFPIYSFQSHKNLSISTRPFKRLLFFSATPKFSRFSIFSNFNPSLQKPSCCCTSTSSSPSTDPNWETTPTTILFVKGLAKSTSQESLKTAFSQFGDASRVKIITDKKTGQSLGFAYVWFSSGEVAQRAVEEMNGKAWVVQNPC
ncbi:hypothetical protein ACH5RR_031238 [Cinchona calisaya]|uniref:RRM domain-containing protein n=1 Tax=Cinchona calisaya TaxID=153742 RepID=A0ABD2YGL7_9GENT